MGSQPRVLREAHEQNCFVTQTAAWHCMLQAGPGTSPLPAQELDVLGEH